MKFAFKLLISLTVTSLIISTSVLRLKTKSRRQAAAAAAAPAAGAATAATPAAAPAADPNALINTFKDPTLKDNAERNNILNNAFLKYIFQVLGYASNDDFDKCVAASAAQAKVNAISAFKKIWANRNETSVQIKVILQNIQCTQIADLEAKINVAGALDKLIKEISQFIKTMRLFLRMFR
jgi:hypothetical protein